MRSARRLLLPVYLLLGACVPVAPADTPTRAAAADAALPPMKAFYTPQPQRPRASNADIARDFIDLAFTLESGRSLRVFTRFEEPITVRVTGAPPASLNADLSRLLHRLRGEAGIDIRRSNSAFASVTIEAVSRAEIRRALPQAACFVVPNVSSLAEYAKARRSRAVNWSHLERRERISIEPSS